MSTVSREADLQLPDLGERRNLRQNVAETLRALLITGKMEPGQLYSAPKLAAQFGVSPTPVREAMLDLVTEGHIEPVRNKGFRVVNPTRTELDELAEIRRYIEPPVMASVARRTPDSAELTARVESLRPAAEEIVEAAGAVDLLRYIDLDTRFHLDFLALHGNGRLVHEVRDLRRRSRLFGLDTMASSGTLDLMAKEHEKMVDLALAGAAEEIETLVRDHIDHVRNEWAGDAGES